MILPVPSMVLTGVYMSDLICHLHLRKLVASFHLGDRNVMSQKITGFFIVHARLIYVNGCIQSIPWKFTHKSQRWWLLSIEQRIFVHQPGTVLWIYISWVSLPWFPWRSTWPFNHVWAFPVSTRKPNSTPSAGNTRHSASSASRGTSARWSSNVGDFVFSRIPSSSSYYWVQWSVADLLAVFAAVLLSWSRGLWDNDLGWN